MSGSHHSHLIVVVAAADIDLAALAIGMTMIFTQRACLCASAVSQVCRSIDTDNGTVLNARMMTCSVRFWHRWQARRPPREWRRQHQLPPPPMMWILVRRWLRQLRMAISTGATVRRRFFLTT